MSYIEELFYETNDDCAYDQYLEALLGSGF